MAHGERWYLVQAKPRLDFLVLLRVKMLGFAVHVPTLIVRDGQVPEPVFPGYVFVRFDAAVDGWQRIASQPGVHRLFSYAPERPQPMPDGEVERWIGQAGAAGVIDARPPAIGAGDEVQVVGGAFADLVTVCRWAEGDRIRVLIEVLGRQVEVPMAAGDVRRVEGAQAGR